MVLAAYRALGCQGLGRADLMIRRQRPPALPAGDQHLARRMTSHSLVPCRRAPPGISYEDLCVLLAAPRSPGRADPTDNGIAPRGGTHRAEP